MVQIDTVATRSYALLGGIGESELPMSVWLANAKVALDLMMVQLQQSNQEYLVSSFTLDGDGVTTEFDVPVSNFSQAYRVDYSVDGQVTWYGNVPIVAHANLMIHKDDGNQAVSFFGSNATNDGKLEFSFAPEAGTTVRVWYEPDVSDEVTFSLTPAIQPVFLSKLAVDTAIRCLPHVKLDSETKRYLAETLRADAGVWLDEWNNWRNRSRHQSVAEIRRFDEGWY